MNFLHSIEFIRLIGYYWSRTILIFNSWIFWLQIPSDEIAKRHWTGNTFGEEYNDKWPKHLYWSYNAMGKKISENFWLIINDGWIDMQIEYFEE